MRYIAEKKENNYLVSGIKTMTTIDNKEVEVVFATKEYNLEKLEEVIKGYEQEFRLRTEQYEADMEDLDKIAEAIRLVK